MKQSSEHHHLWERSLLSGRMQHLKVTCFRSHTHSFLFFFSFSKKNALTRVQRIHEMHLQSHAKKRVVVGFLSEMALSVGGGE